MQFKDMHKVKVRNRHSSESPRCFAIAHRHYVTKAKFTNLFVMGCPKAVSQPYVEKVCVCVHSIASYRHRDDRWCDPSICCQPPHFVSPTPVCAQVQTFRRQRVRSAKLGSLHTSSWCALPLSSHPPPQVCVSPARVQKCSVVEWCVSGVGARVSE